MKKLTIDHYYIYAECLDNETTVDETRTTDPLEAWNIFDKYKEDYTKNVFRSYYVGIMCNGKTLDYAAV